MNFTREIESARTKRGVEFAFSKRVILAQYQFAKGERVWRVQNSF